MSISHIKAEDTTNHEDIEKQWAVKALHHAETYFSLISKIDPSRLKLTPIDDEIYKHFRQEFPDLNINQLDEMKDFKSEAKKSQWREFMKSYETKIEDYNFGSLVRVNPQLDYDGDNAIFVTRIQFYCIEIARNKEGSNEAVYKKC